MRDKKGRFIKGHSVTKKTKKAVSMAQKRNTYRRGSHHTRKQIEEFLVGQNI
jgi:hypothetical protein